MTAARPHRRTIGGLAAIGGLAILVGYLAVPLLRCADSCFVDYFAIRDGRTAHFEIPDARLNAWILGWVQHALFTQPTRLFDTNAFHPAPNTLAGSEHMLGVALQVLPLRLVSGSAVLLHQAALVLSFAILALTTFALTRWLTGSNWAAFLAGAVAPFMPWRYSELGHLQLLSVQWLPLVWLLAARLLSENRRRDAIWLAAVASLQMLSSFYLAYLTLFTTAVIAAFVLVAMRPTRAALLRFAAAFAVPCGLVAITALPYLRRFSAYRYSEASSTELVANPAMVLGVLAPPLSLRAELAGLAPVTYHAPLVVLGFAVLALCVAARSRDADAHSRRLRAFTFALFTACAGAVVLMLGRKLDIGGVSLTLPSHWLAQFVPGFSQMRAEFRWGIVIGVAAPVLAGVGVAYLTRRFESAGGRGGAAKHALRFATAALFALNLYWFQLPARDAWAEASDVRAAHQALARLEPGPAVEIPWALHVVSIVSTGSQYMLASSEDWRPLLNGYTAYIPSSHYFLQRLAYGLPDPDSISVLNRLTGLRWIVLHPDRLGPPARRRWTQAERSGALQLAASGPGFRIYAVPQTRDSGSWIASLLAETPGAQTMGGLPRSRLVAPGSGGTLAVEADAEMRFQHLLGMPEPATVTVFNPSDSAWPGLDIQPEGLVQLRCRFRDEGGSVVYEDVAGFDRDFPPQRTTTAHAILHPPARVGRFAIEYDLVQRIGDDLRELGVPPATASVHVIEHNPAQP